MKRSLYKAIPLACVLSLAGGGLYAADFGLTPGAAVRRASATDPAARALTSDPAARASAPADPSPEIGNHHLKTIGLSILLPGLAQVTEGAKNRGIAYMVAEGAIWTGFATYRVQGNLRKDSYVQMAQLYAGVARPGGRNDDYYGLLDTWPSSDFYNEYVIARQARDLYPTDLAGRAAYLEAHKIPDDEAWSWQSNAAWNRYHDKRSDSQRAYRRARNMLALAVTNRVVALLDAALFLRPSGARARLALELAPGSNSSSAELLLHYSIP